MQNPRAVARDTCLGRGDRIKEKVDVPARQHFGVAEGFIIHYIVVGRIEADVVDAHIVGRHGTGGSGYTRWR